MSRATSLVLAATLALIAGDTARSAAALHPYHKTLAEVEFVAERGVLEVAFWVWPPDLAAALSARSRRRVELEKEGAKLDAMLRAWLGDVFVVRGKSGEVCAHTWVGKELSQESCWLYFEVDVSKSREVLELENRAYFAVTGSPLHLTTFVRGTRRTVRNLTREASRWRLPISAS